MLRFSQDDDGNMIISAGDETWGDKLRISPDGSLAFWDVNPDYVTEENWFPFPSWNDMSSVNLPQWFLDAMRYVTE